MRLKNFLLIICALVLFCSYFPGVGYCWLAQEPTQVAILGLAKKELEKLTAMVAAQDKMIKHLDAAAIASIAVERGKIVEGFKNIKKILQATDVLTHMTDNIEIALKKRHPEWQSGLSVAQLKARNEDRDKNWKATAQAYLKAVNLTAKDFATDNVIREAIMKLLNNPSGQTQAIQVLGALLEHADSMLVRNEQSIQGFMTTYLEYERDEIDKREQMGKGIIEACGSLKTFRPAARNYNMGF